MKRLIVFLPLWPMLFGLVARGGVFTAAGTALAQATSPQTTIPQGARPTENAKIAPAKLPTQPASAAAGKNIYMQNCVGCHGRAVEGGIAPSIRSAGKMTLPEFKDVLLRGRLANGQRLRSTMPRFGKGFRPHAAGIPSDAEFKSLQLFLKQSK